ncbi:MAG: LysR family transcriptional regulator [Pantoea sp.]|uniref:LysR family transcriptional regulator n=1 Tax=Pantoea TaxID=53335 RepID=UPI0028A6E298|nr:MULTISPECIES: LysR family transcriptional regulator [Pantoea]MDU1573661.1 LysR family transcriptional regulator [Pantoea sp.]
MPDIDLNLLTALDALLTECSVTGAARRMGLSVSAMSRALTRLRAATGDPLLVQAGRQMVPTPYAAELASRVAHIARSAQAILQPPADRLNLASIERSFLIRANESFVDLAAAALTAELRQTAPLIRLVFVAKRDKAPHALRSGEIDLEIGVLGTDAPELKLRTLFSDRFVGICRRDHPLLQAPGVTAERYASYPHVVVSRHNKQGGPVDVALASLGWQRRVSVVVPAFANALPLVRASDMLGLVTLSSLNVVASGMAAGDVVPFELPVVTPAISIAAIWHPRLQADPLHRWLRETLIAVCRREQATWRYR